jgi:hypothetical protein
MEILQKMVGIIKNFKTKIMEKQSYVSTKELLINTQIPVSTKSYKAISHQQLMDLTLESIHQAGFELDKETYSGAKDGQVGNGRYTIKNIADSEMQLQIGWQNSYDKSLSLKFAIGTRIFICQNGCVSGDFGAFRKKHVGSVQEFTPSAITEYIKRSGDVFSKIQEERETMKKIEMTKRTSSELIGRMFLEEEIIQSTQLNIIKREMDNPSFDYGATGSMWELYNHTTLAMKELHPSLWMNNHMKAHSFFVNASGILSTSPAIIVENIPQMEESMFTQLELQWNLENQA